MEKSPTTSVATVMTFYHDLTDEVDQHFARALQSATTPVHSQGDALLKEPGRCTSSCKANHRQISVNVN